jgi:hypothetical protein
MDPKLLAGYGSPSSSKMATGPELIRKIKSYQRKTTIGRKHKIGTGTVLRAKNFRKYFDCETTYYI